MKGFPGGSAVKNLPAVQETRVQSLDWEDPLEEGMATTPVFLPRESHGQRNLVAVVHGAAQSRTRLKRLSSCSSIMSKSNFILLRMDIQFSGYP